MSQVKAAKVTPPTNEPKIVEVNMTTTYAVMTTLSVATVGLTVATVSLWRRVRETQRDIETLTAFTTRVINDTECGAVAYQNLVDRAEAEEAASVADVSNEFTEEEPTNEPRRVRATLPSTD